MIQFLVLLFVFGFIVAIFDWLFSVAIPVIIVYILFPIITFYLIRFIYRLFKSDRSEALSQDQILGQGVNKAYDDAKNWHEKEQERIQNIKNKKDEIDRLDKEKESSRIKHRDGNFQNTPYTYKIGIHGNESLAIRYGIANQENKIKKYYYFEKGGVKKHDKDRDENYYVPSNKIRVQKINRVKGDLYEVYLSDYRDRIAMAVIEKGTEYVKTFYPIDEEWFNQYRELELTLKGNGSFSLKELATFHVNKTVNNK